VHVIHSPKQSHFRSRLGRGSPAARFATRGTCPVRATPCGQAKSASYGNSCDYGSCGSDVFLFYETSVSETINRLGPKQVSLYVPVCTAYPMRELQKWMLHSPGKQTCKHLLLRKHCAQTCKPFFWSPWTDEKRGKQFRA
jgi:hypothetical protein